MLSNTYCKADLNQTAIVWVKNTVKDNKVYESQMVGPYMEKLLLRGLELLISKSFESLKYMSLTYFAGSSYKVV